MGNLRLIPVVIFAAASLLAIKTVGFISGGPPPEDQRTFENEIWSYFTGVEPSQVDPIVTGQTPDKAPKGPVAALPKEPPPPKSVEPSSQSPAERALIERLQERRQELEARARDLEMRENLIKAAEKQLESRISELKGLESGEGEAPERIKTLVVMYEAMGPKEAARIFDRLDPRTTAELVNQMNPRKVSEILAKMQPEAAERLTLELARRRAAEPAMPATDLKRIDANKAR